MLGAYALHVGGNCAKVGANLQENVCYGTPNSGSSRLKRSDFGPCPRRFQFKKLEITTFPTFLSKQNNEPRSFRFNVKNTSVFERLFKTIVFYDK